MSRRNGILCSVLSQIFKKFTDPPRIGALFPPNKQIPIVRIFKIFCTYFYTNWWYIESTWWRNDVCLHRIIGDFTKTHTSARKGRSAWLISEICEINGWWKIPPSQHSLSNVLGCGWVVFNLQHNSNAIQISGYDNNFGRHFTAYSMEKDYVSCQDPRAWVLLLTEQRKEEAHDPEIPK